MGNKMGRDKMAEKDKWDKAEIVGKIFGATLTPLMVVVATAVWKSEREQTETNSAYRQTATAVLTAPSAAVRTDPVLQPWALDVLKQPTAPPPLDEDVYDKLRELTAEGAFVSPITSERLLDPSVTTEDFVAGVIENYIQQQQPPLPGGSRSLDSLDRFRQPQAAPSFPPSDTGN